MTHTHLSDAERDRAALYALDALDPDERRTFEDHLKGGCRLCRTEVGALTDVADELVWSAPPVTPPPRLRDRLLAAVEPAGEGLHFIRRTEGVWTTVAPGVHRKDLTPTPHGNVFLIRLDPGAAIPTHPHHCVEHCYVVEGDASLGDVTLGAGDHHVADRGTVHTGLRTRGGCVILIMEAHA